MLRVLCYSKNMKKYVIKIDRTDIKSILQYCRENGIDLCPAPCGGKGTCGKCKVHVTKPYDNVVLAFRHQAFKMIRTTWPPNIFAQDARMLLVDLDPPVANANGAV